MANTEKWSVPLGKVCLTLDELEAWLETQRATNYLAASEFGFVADYAKAIYGLQDAFIYEIGEQCFAELSRIGEEDVTVQIDAGAQFFYFREQQKVDMDVVEALQLAQDVRLKMQAN